MSVQLFSVFAYPQVCSHIPRSLFALLVAKKPMSPELGRIGWKLGDSSSRDLLRAVADAMLFFLWVLDVRTRLL